MFGHVLVRRLIAAQGSAACLTRTQMNPIIARFYTFFANKFLCSFERVYFADVLTN
jgi:hypothetical protein